MQPSDPHFITSLLKQFEQKDLLLDNWKNTLSQLSFDQLNTLVPQLLMLVQKDESFYDPYFKLLLYYDQNEDRLTDVMEIIMTHTSEQLLTNDWYCFLWSDFLSSSNSQILVKNFFYFTNQLHNTFQLQFSSKLIQSLERSSSSYVKLQLLNFLLEHKIWFKENNEILLRFFNADIETKLQLVTNLSKLEKPTYVSLFRSILFDKRIQSEQMVSLSILFQMQFELPQLFKTYKQFEKFVSNLKEEKTLELLFSEFTKPDSVTIPWIQQLIFFFLNQNTNIANFIIEASGEYIEEWQPAFRESFLQLILSSYNNLKETLAKILSPLWYDEQVIHQLLTSDNKTVLETLYESVITIYTSLSSNLQDYFQQLFETTPEYAKFGGLLVGYNFQVETFRERIIQSLDLIDDLNQEQFQSGMLVGLGLKWMELDTTIKTLIKNKITNMSIKQKQELKHGLEMVYGLLDLETINLVTNLQSFDPQYEIGPDDIQFE